MKKPVIYIFLYLLITVLLVGCDNNTSATTNAAVKVKEQQPVKARAQTAKANETTNDEKQFRVFLNEFKQAVKKGDKAALATMLYFPLQTTPQWSNEDLKSSAVNPAEGLVTSAEYPQYANDIFSKDAMRIIPKSSEDDLAEIDNNTDENYYKTLKTETDKGGKLYELQQQYQQNNGKETSYGFVFGKIKGRYKIISYFCPWPVKG